MMVVIHLTILVYVLMLCGELSKTRVSAYEKWSITMLSQGQRLTLILEKGIKTLTSVVSATSVSFLINMPYL